MSKSTCFSRWSFNVSYRLLPQGELVEQIKSIHASFGVEEDGLELALFMSPKNGKVFKIDTQVIKIEFSEAELSGDVKDISEKIYSEILSLEFS